MAARASSTVLIPQIFILVIGQSLQVKGRRLKKTLDLRRLTLHFRKLSYLGSNIFRSDQGLTNKDCVYIYLCQSLNVLRCKYSTFRDNSNIIGKHRTESFCCFKRHVEG